MTAPHFHRIAEGDYETADGHFRLYRLRDVYPPAWNVEDLTFDDRELATPHNDALIVDGASTKREAVGLFADWLDARRSDFLNDQIDVYNRLIQVADTELATMPTRYTDSYKAAKAARAAGSVVTLSAHGWKIHEVAAVREP